MSFSWSFITVVTFALSFSAQVQGAVTSAPKKVTCPTGHVTGNAKCCALFPIIDTLQEKLFDGSECGEEAHSALRLSFHDAIGFSLHGGKGDGADGSILAFNLTEIAYHANSAIDDIVAAQWPVFQEIGTLSAGDFVHLAAAVGISNCPGAPRLDFMLGRPAPKGPAPDLTVPEPTDSVTKILARMAEAGFSPSEVIALLASHTIAAADAVDESIPGTPFDSTVGTFDSQVFLEVLLKGTAFPSKDNLANISHPGEVLSPIAGEMRLASDFAFSQDPRTACFWQEMINDQQRMTSQFKAAMAKLQVLGQNTHLLTDCSDVIPTAAPFAGPIKYPASFSRAQIQQACHAQPFPVLSTVAGPAPTLAPVPGS